MNASTYECNGQVFTITIRSTFSGAVFQPEDFDPHLTVEVADKINREIYVATISCSLASYISTAYGATIPDFLTNAAKSIIDARSK